VVVESRTWRIRVVNLARARIARDAQTARELRYLSRKTVPRPAQLNTKASPQPSPSESSEQNRLAEVYCIRITGINSVGHLRLRWLATRELKGTDERGRRIGRQKTRFIDMVRDSL
jgi:hypothetical protein